MNNIKGLCFDLFSTLVSVARVPEHLGTPTAELLGVDSRAWNKACFGPHHEICRPTRHEDIIRSIAHSLDETIPLERIQQATIARQARFDHALKEVDASVLESLSGLQKAGYRLALVSNASTAEVMAWSESPLQVFFDVVLFSCECGIAKPNREIYQLALKELDMPAEQCLFVGDGGSDEHFGAAEIGMLPVLSSYFLSESDSQQRYTKYQSVLHHHVGSIRELSDYLSGKRR